MSYRVSSDVDGGSRITLTGEPSYCHALDGTTSEGELDFDDGIWLVMDFAVWSMPDVTAVQTALDTARYFDGPLNLGLIPYDDSEDLDAWPWHDDSNDPGPHWVLMRDGVVTWRHNGIPTLDELIDVVCKVLT
jgi:hypothetical protein